MHWTYADLLALPSHVYTELMTWAAETMTE